MKITRRSRLSCTLHTREIDITEEQLQQVENRRKEGKLIQAIVPHLSADDREFLITGITPEEWNSVFKH